MESTSSVYTLNLEEVIIDGSFAQQDKTVGSRTFKNVYIIDSAENFDIFLKYHVKTGYFDSSIHIMASPFDAERNSFDTAADWYKNNPFLVTGAYDEIYLNVDYSSLNKNTVYLARAAYIQSGRYQSLGSLYFGFPEGAGVNDILVDETLESPVYFSLQGLRLDAPAKGQIVIRKTGNKIEKIIF